MTKKNHVAVIGGGAAGLMAAITAVRNGAQVTLFERQERVGKKILVTGNGRCNLTNMQCTPAGFVGADSQFVVPVLNRFPVAAALAFFHDLGLCTMEESAGRVFPVTGQASTVLDLLRFEVERIGVSVQVAADITMIIPKNRSFTVRWRDGEVAVDRVVATPGGKAFPHLSGTGGGIDLLTRLGHTVEPLFPALVPLKTDLPFNRGLKGVKVDAAVTLRIDDQAAAVDKGEVLFTDYGLSGPPIIQLSLAANRAAAANRAIAVRLDMFSTWSADDLACDIDKRNTARPDQPLDCALIGLIHKRLIVPVIKSSGIADPQQPIGKLTPEDRRRIVGILKGWTIPVTGSLSWNDAHVMAGGVSTAGFDPATLESRRIPGLWAAGEVLDVTGECGGHNLQWAWSSGYVAGLHAATV
jgi:predicted Rossmann fold flavoprotein